MTAARTPRNRELRERRMQRAALAEIAREFKISKTRVVQILDETGGDPLWIRRTADLRDASASDLDRESRRLADRIRADLGRLMSVREEQEARRTDRILGLPG